MLAYVYIKPFHVASIHISSNDWILNDGCTSCTGQLLLNGICSSNPKFNHATTFPTNAVFHQSEMHSHFLSHCGQNKQEHHKTQACTANLLLRSLASSHNCHNVLRCYNKSFVCSCCTIKSMKLSELASCIIACRTLSLAEESLMWEAELEGAWGCKLPDSCSDCPFDAALHSRTVSSTLGIFQCRVHTDSDTHWYRCRYSTGNT